jgi:hypothetical protein
MVGGPEEIVLFEGSQDTLLKSVHRGRDNNRNLCLRQLQIVCHLHPHFVQSALEEDDTGLISAIGDSPLMAGSLTPLRKIDHRETTMGAQLPGP